MAQAPQGPPRKTTTYNDFSGMASDNARSNVKQDEMFFLENIMRTAPHKLHSVPGPLLKTTLPPPGCPDLFPAAQTLPQVCCYNVDSGWGIVGANHHGMFAHADDNGDLWFTISTNTGFGVGTYLPNSTTEWYLLKGAADCSVTQVGGPSDIANLVPFTGYTMGVFAGQTPQAGTCGTSDEKCYKISGSGISPLLLGVEGAATVFFGASTGASALIFRGDVYDPDVSPNAWTKFGNQFFGALHEFGTETKIARFPLPAPNGTYQDLYVDCITCLPGFRANPNMTNENILYMHKTANFLWVLATNGGSTWTDAPSTGERLYKLDADLNYITHWSLDADPNFTSPWAFFTRRDADLIFLIENVSLQNYKIGFFDPNTGLTTVIGTAASLCTNAGNAVGPAGQSGFYYAKNYFYLSYSGFGLGLTNVLKLGPLTCPSNPVIPWEN